MLDTAARNVETLTEKIAECVLVAFPTSRRSSSILTPNMTTTRIKEKDASKLEDEYRRLVEGLQQSDENVEDEDFMANPSECGGMTAGSIPHCSPTELPQHCHKTCSKRPCRATFAEPNTSRRSSLVSSSTSR